MAGRLFVVGTPIGNLGDMSRRARETLAAVDLVAAEDTRRTGRLLAHFDVKAKLISHFEGNERERTAQLLDALREGSDVALVTDGGMPGISDPGFRLVRACANEGIEVRVVPGPSAAISALVVSGLPSDRFVFEGFLPKREGERSRRLEALARDRRTIILFESPLRVQILLRDVLVTMGDRRVAVARELTKVHEEVLRGRASDVLGRIADLELKGEVAVVIEGAPERSPADVTSFVPETKELVAGGMKKREAARAVAERHGLSANALYRALLDAFGTP
ncbi:MAG TPA: 16S rRNA (cytidine(1402)-2'-O)-methyltransferase [Actinomycetota bacterium]|jgi:16S rRNA (cytidine1402-2'-O)-methyltransferase|nr:16S rRNA (cytidine(1402)-2'-O)-methyltransferase [Actinomycetota bacterium]